MSSDRADDPIIVHILPVATVAGWAALVAGQVGAWKAVVRELRNMAPKLYTDKLLPREATDALPGSDEKIRIMAKRHHDKKALHHPYDRGYYFYHQHKHLCLGTPLPSLSAAKIAA